MAIVREGEQRADVDEGAFHCFVDTHDGMAQLDDAAYAEAVGELAGAWEAFLGRCSTQRVL